jgi:hypothetical protein
MIGSMAFIIVAALMFLPSALFSSLIQVRKFTNTLILFIFLTAVASLLQQNIHLSHFILFSLPLGIIVAMVLMQIKRKVVAEVIHLILILLVLAIQFLPLFNII